MKIRAAGAFRASGAVAAAGVGAALLAAAGAGAQGPPAAVPSPAGGGHARHAAATAERTPDQLPVKGPLGVISLAPTATFDAQGTLWLAWVEGQRVYVSASRDEGKTFAVAKTVNPEPEAIDVNSESRPKIAVGSKGEVFITYTHKLSKPYTGEIRFSRSVDGGATFSTPITLNDDRLETGHRFDALSVSPDGRVWVFWIDKRDLDRATAEQKPYSGAALYFTVSTDAGRTFAANRKVKDNICECCRLALAIPSDGLPVVLWRDILPGDIRDHAIVRFETPGDPGAVGRASFDDWVINGCPHQGPSLAVSEGTYHLAWFTGAGPRGPGSFYARSTDGGKTFTQPRQLGAPGRGTRPYVLALGKAAHVTWKEPLAGGGGVAVRLSSSSDGGATWSDPVDLARGAGDSDHPFLVQKAGRAFLSWFDARKGYQLIALDSPRSARQEAWGAQAN